MKEALDLTWSTLGARLRNYRRSSFLVLGWAAMLIVLLLVFRRPPGPAVAARAASHHGPGPGYPE